MNKFKIFIILSVVVVTSISIFIATFHNSSHDKAKYIYFKDYKALDTYFKKIGYNNLNNPPKLYVKHLPVNLKDAPPSKRKELFVKILLPMIKSLNKDLENQRKEILKAVNKNDSKTISKYLKLYKAKNINDLLLRVNKIPVDIVLAQAAIESGWGTSRFAIEGNNIFGEWTFEKGTGMIPKNRPEGKTYEVKKFPDLMSSLKSYAMNLNTSPFYEDFRKARSGEKAEALEETLTAYSTKREEYVNMIKRVIKSNDFSSLNNE